MDSSEPFDYMAAIEQIRKESRQSKTRLRAPDPVRIRTDEPVDYMAAVKAWDRERAGKGKVNMHTGKDPRP